MHQQVKNIKGFNLLELLVVIVIVGIISGVAYPNFSKWSKEREVRQASERIHSLMKNIHIQTERGTFGYVQIIFNNTADSLKVYSKGMTIQSLASKIHDGDDPWNLSPYTSRCNNDESVDNYWDTDDNGPNFSEEIKNIVYELTFENITTNFTGKGAICFSRNGKFFEGSFPLAVSEASTTPQEVIYICRRTSSQPTCDIDYLGRGSGGAQISGTDGSESSPSEDDIRASASVKQMPNSEMKYLRAVTWNRFGNITLSLFEHCYSSTTEGKEWTGGNWDDQERDCG